LHEMDYTLQGNRKSMESEVTRADRDAQFRHINDPAGTELRAPGPAVAVNTKKRNSSGITRMAARSGVRKEVRLMGLPMICRSLTFLGLCHTACMTGRRTTDG
jgi:hypothetical protein